MARRAKIEDVVAGLGSPDEGERREAGEALEALRRIGLGPREGRAALRAATRQFPGRQPLFDPAADLVWAAAAQPRPEYIPLIVELYPQYGDEAKDAALNLLARLPDREAAVAYMEIVRKHGPTGEVPELATFPLESEPRHADVFFPELLEYAANPALAPDVYRLALAYCEAGLLRTATLLPFTPAVLEAYARHKGRLLPAQRPEGIAWMWEDDYVEARWDAEVLLGLLGYFPAPEVVAELREALGYQDPQLKYHAVASLLRLGEEVGAAHITDVAASAATRNRLYDYLQERDQLALFPPDFRTQEAFAESNMVGWLTYPTELGRAPDEIELMDVVAVDIGPPHGILDYYVFRFRTYPPHWMAEDGWLAGVAGPFLRKDAPSTTAYGETFSTFEPWDSATPEEHVGEIHDIIARWHEHRSGNGH